MPERMRPVRYGQGERWADAYHGWRDGRAEIPARQLTYSASGPATTPHREALIRLAQDAFAQEHLEYQRLVAEPHRRIMAGRARLETARQSLTWARSAMDMETRPLDPAASRRRRLGEEHHPETVIVQRRQRDQRRLAARAKRDVMTIQAEIAEAEASLAAAERESQQQHQAAAVRVRRIHEYIHRRLAVYRRALIRAHPDGAWANSVLSVRAPEIPGWALPGAYLPEGVPVPDRAPDGEDEQGPVIEEDQEAWELVLRRDVTRFGSSSQSDNERVAYEHLTAPVAAPWHFTIARKGERLELRSRRFGHGPYIDGEQVTGTAMLRPGDSFDFAESRYTMLDSRRLRVAVIGQPNLVVAGLNATSKSKVRLSGMSFIQREQTVLAILGPSGAGKSSLFAALLGELPLDSGRLYFAGLPMKTHSRQIRDQLGFVPQQVELHLSLTVEETLRYGFGLRSPQGRHRREQAIDDALRVVKLTDQRYQLLCTLSGGQLRRVSIALELLTNPPLLLLDEPTSGLDAYMDREIMEFLRGYAHRPDPREPGRKRTVAVVTHATENLFLADQLLVVAEDGAPAYSGPPRPIRKRFRVRTYAEVMHELMDKPREWAGKYRDGRAAADAVREADQLDQRSDADVRKAAAIATRAGGARPRSPRMVARKLEVLVRRQCALLASRALTKNDRGLLDHLKNLGVVSLPLTVAAVSALLAAVVVASPGLGGASPSTAGPTSLSLLTTLAILSGQALTYSDVVNEIGIIRREGRAGVGAFTVLLSKWLVYAMVALAQAAMITWVFCAVPGRSPARYLFIGPEADLFFSLAAVTVSAMTLGLLVSVLAPKLEHAVVMVTAISIAQIAINGVTSHLYQRPLLGAVGAMFPDRWGLAAAASSVGLRRIDQAAVGPDALWSHTSGQWLYDTLFLAFLTVLYFALATWCLNVRVRPKG